MDRELARQRLQRGVFVGRDGELQRLHEALKRAAAGQPRLVLLHGEAGIGKTALAGQLIMLAEAEGWWCGRAQSFEPSLEPYAPWGTIVDAVTRGEDADALRRRLGRLAHAVADLTVSGLGFGERPAASDEHRADEMPPEDRSLHLARCQGVSELLCDAARRAPVLVVLEDLHAADAPALQVLEHVAMHAGGARLLLVGTYRDDGGAAPNGARSVGSRLPTGFCERIGVAALRPDDVRAMLQQVAGQAPPGLVDRLQVASGGNPLLLVMILWDLLEAGALVHDGSTGRSRLALDDLAIPDSAGSLLDRRLERLGEGTRVVLQLASLYHSDFDLERLDRLGVLSRDQLAAGLDAALGTGLIVGTGPPGRFRFRHGVFRRVLHARIGIAGRAQYHRLIGKALEARPHLGDDGVLEAAYHFRQAAEAGDVEPAVRWTLRAADLEWGRHSHEAAAEHYRRALALADGIAWCDDAWRLDVLTRRLEALGLAGKIAELRETTREAIPLARRFGAERLTSVALAACGTVRGFGRLRYDAETVALLEEALASEPADPARRALLQARLAEELTMGSGADNLRARELMNAALADLPHCTDPHVASAVLRSLHWAPSQTGGPHARMLRIQELMALATRAHDAELALEGEIARALAFLELGNPVSARAALARILDAAGPRPYYRWALACMQGCLAYVEGRLDEVEGLAHEAMRLGTEAEIESAGVVVAAQLGAILWQRGEFDTLDVGLRALATAEPQAYAAVETVVRCAQAAGWAESGRDRDALACVEEYARDDFETIAHNALWLPSLAFLALACRGPGAAPLARRLYALLVPYADIHVLLPLMVSYGSVEYFLGVLAEAFGDAEAATLHFERALVSNRRAGTAHWLARTQLALARRLLASGAGTDRARAEALLDDAEHTSTRLGLAVVSAAIGSLRSAAPAATPDTLRPCAATPVFSFRRQERGFYIESPAGTGGFEPFSRALDTAHQLVCRRGIAVAALDLVHEGKTLLAEHGEVVDLGCSGERTDARALADVRADLERMQDALLTAEETGNHARSAEIRESLSCLERYLGDGQDRRGRPRSEVTASDRAYGTVYQRLHRAMVVLGARWPDIAAHLEDTLKTGRECIYDPDPASAPVWILD